MVIPFTGVLEAVVSEFMEVDWEVEALGEVWVSRDEAGVVSAGLEVVLVPGASGDSIEGDMICKGAYQSIKNKNFLWFIYEHWNIYWG